MVGKIEKHHEERYRKLLKNVQDKVVFSRDGDCVGGAPTAAISSWARKPDDLPLCGHPRAISKSARKTAERKPFSTDKKGRRIFPGVFSLYIKRIALSHVSERNNPIARTALPVIARRRIHLARTAYQSLQSGAKQSTWRGPLTSHCERAKNPFGKDRLPVIASGAETIHFRRSETIHLDRLPVIASGAETIHWRDRLPVIASGRNKSTWRGPFTSHCRRRSEAIHGRGPFTSHCERSETIHLARTVYQSLQAGTVYQSLRSRNNPLARDRLPVIAGGANKSTWHCLDLIASALYATP